MRPGDRRKLATARMRETTQPMIRKYLTFVATIAFLLYLISAFARGQAPLSAGDSAGGRTAPPSTHDHHTGTHYGWWWIG